ncbi:MAG: MoaD/ThiS family protein [Deltaproteobacteria bacterium]|nr:MoaD/ThiS family protein [Deltaproteobacteria bacterium]
MRISVKCYATLSDHNPPGGFLDLAEGLTVDAMLPDLGLGADDIKLVFINSKNSSLATTLADGDQVGLFPAVGGG